jgi:hypothetical protein
MPRGPKGERRIAPALTVPTAPAARREPPVAPVIGLSLDR